MMLSKLLSSGRNLKTEVSKFIDVDVSVPDSQSKKLNGTNELIPSELPASFLCSAWSQFKTSVLKSSRHLVDVCECVCVDLTSVCPSSLKVSPHQV